VVKADESVEQLIQVKYASAKNEIEERELEALEIAASELKCENLLIITWDYEATTPIDNKTVKLVPLWKWLLKTQ
jgi:predicted AAA+ superfamily ATPase